MSADDATEAIDVSASGGDDADGVRRLAVVKRGRPRFAGVTSAGVDGPTLGERDGVLNGVFFGIVGAFFVARVF